MKQWAKQGKKYKGFTINEKFNLTHNWKVQNNNEIWRLTLKMAENNLRFSLHCVDKAVGGNIHSNVKYKMNFSDIFGGWFDNIYENLSRCP